MQSEIALYKRPFIHNGFSMKIGTVHKYGVLYPIAMAEINKIIQDEKNRYVKFMQEVAEKNIPKIGVDKNKMNFEAQEALRSKNVNDIVGVDGPPLNAIQPLPATHVSTENKELLSIFQQQTEKGWSISETRLAGKSNAEFMGEIEIQESGFKSRTSDLQEGLRMFIEEQLDCLKDIIITFWDGEYFFKVTSGVKPKWYTSQLAPNPLDTSQNMIINPLTDILSGDYEIKVDISSAFKPNNERRKKRDGRIYVCPYKPEYIHVA